jgi:hypothetical protein
MITGDATTLMRQAPMTAQGYLMEAVECIDNEFGQGYAKNHPDLVAAFMHVSGQDFTMAILAKAIGEAAEELARAVNDASANLSA